MGMQEVKSQMGAKEFGKVESADFGAKRREREMVAAVKKNRGEWN